MSLFARIEIVKDEDVIPSHGYRIRIFAHRNQARANWGKGLDLGVLHAHGRWCRRSEAVKTARNVARELGLDLDRKIHVATNPKRFKYLSDMDKEARLTNRERRAHHIGMISASEVASSISKGVGEKVLRKLNLDGKP
jgi:hypothetical protein